MPLAPSLARSARLDDADLGLLGRVFGGRGVLEQMKLFSGLKTCMSPADPCRPCRPARTLSSSGRDLPTLDETTPSPVACACVAQWLATLTWKVTTTVQSTALTCVCAHDVLTDTPRRA